MRLKRTLVSAIAALGLAGTLVTPVALAQTAPPTESNSGNNTATAQVEVTTDGEFDVYFSAGSFDLSDVTLDANTWERTATGKLQIAYTDTLANRPEFDVRLSASNFENASFPNSGDPNKQLAAQDFEIVKTYNVAQGQWGGPKGQPGDIGDIGFRIDGNPIGSQAASDGLWSPGATNLSGQGVEVQFGYAGIGTVWSTGDVDVAVKVPSQTVAGTYTSNLTVTVVAGQTP